MPQPLSFNTTSFGVGSAGPEKLEKAILHLNQALLADNSYLDLSDLLLASKYSEPSFSGLQDNDYPYKFLAGADLNEIAQIKKTALPPELVERFAYMQCNCLMGLFPAIKRAWLSIDSDIFMWNYEDGSDVAYYDGLSETILCATLVQPKAGIFQPHIVYLLCLATAVDIVLLGVSFRHTGSDSDGKYEEMHLVPEPLFAVSTDNVHITSMQSTVSGRIFMAGKDGCLYELYYQAEDGWFSRRCRKINHSKGLFSMFVPTVFSFTDDDPLVQISVDDSRHLLYTLSEKGNIQLFDIGSDADSQKTSRLASLSQKHVVDDACRIARTVENSSFRPIIHISALSKAESSNVHLVGVTTTGTRFYFTTTDYSGSLQSTCKPRMLRLIHVRLPPGYTIQSTQGRPSNVHAAFYKRGVLLLASSQSEDSDILWMLSDDAFPFRRELSESHDVISLVGRTWLMAESCQNALPPSSMLPNTVAFAASNDERPDPPAVVTQHLQIDRQFVIVNSLGTTILTKCSPVGQLHQLLVQYGPESEQVKSYFKIHREQACATCLVLICSRSLEYQQANDLAIRAFFLYGGAPEYALQDTAATSIHNTSLAYPPQSSTPFSNVTRNLNFTSPGTSAIVPPSSQSFNTTGSTPLHPGVDLQATPVPSQFTQISFSCKHNSLYLYLGRLLRPLWQYRMVTEIEQVLKTKERVIHLMSIFDGDQLTWIMHKLMELKDFVEANASVIATTASAAAAVKGDSIAHSSQRTSGVPGGTAPDNQMTKRYRTYAETEENISLIQLQQLITLSCEYLGLWKILCDHQFNVIARSLTKDQQLALQNVTFELLVTNGQDVCQALAKRLVDMYISDNAATDVINARLREVCPSLYSCHDEVYSKGFEKLKLAKTAGCGTERDKYVSEAVEQFKVIATRIDLPSTCEQFASLKCYSGIVDLVLTAASKRDPQNLALHFYVNSKPTADIQGSQAYNIRMDCYKVILETMDYLLSTTHFNPQAPSVPKVPGPPPAHDAGRLSSAEAQHYIDEMFGKILQSNDQMVHVALFDWLIYKNMSEKLLEIQSPYLEQYLKHSTSVIHTESVEMLDLHWKFFEKQKNFSAAARILASLAESRNTRITLNQRVEYLSRAAICAKSCTSHMSVPGDGEFLHELEEKMEVARLQLHIFDILSKNKSKYRGSVIDHALERLKTELLEISVLYSEFAEPFELPECKLAIVHCAGYYDPALVETLWRDIIDKELEVTARLDVQVRVQSLYAKLVSQGRKYSSTENYFPIVNLVRYLEKLSCNARLNLAEADATFVFRAMLDVSVGFPFLFDVYNKIFKFKDSDWKNNQKPYHLLHVIGLLLNHFIRKPQIIPSVERHAFVTKALDAVASYLVELEAETTVNVGQLIADLRDLQANLQRVN